MSLPRLSGLPPEDAVLVGNAIDLARDRFMLEQTRRAFLGAVERVVAGPSSTTLVT